ncbi:MAG: hypothetical protein D6735_01145, partial [Acidobacteria bacterium]
MTAAARVLEKLPHARLKEGLGGFLILLMAVWRHDQLFGFRHKHGAEELGIDRAQVVAQPDVEEVAQVAETDVIVVRR